MCWSTMDNIAKEWKLINSSDETIVSTKCGNLNGIVVPMKDGEEIVRAKFKIMTVEDNDVIVKISGHKVWNEMAGDFVIEPERNMFSLLLLKRLLLDWNIDIPIERENGWLTEECWNRVKNVNALVITDLLDKYQDIINMTDKEEAVINKQSTVLFSTTSGGVYNACDAISMFCLLSSFWEKFGLDKDKIKQLPYRDFVSLRMIMKHENDAMKRNSKSVNKNPTRVAGPRGSRPSRGQVIARD